MDSKDPDGKWAECLPLFEALLTRSNIFSTPKILVPGSPAKRLPLSDKPFLEPNSALATVLVMLPAGPKDQKSGKKTKRKKDKHDKKDSKCSKAKPDLGSHSGPVLKGHFYN